MDSQSTLLTQGLDGSPTRNLRSSSDRPTQFFRTLTEQASPSDSTPNPDSTGLRGGNSGLFPCNKSKSDHTIVTLAVTRYPEEIGKFDDGCW